MRNEEVSLHPPLRPAEGVQRVPVPVRSVCGSVRPAAVVSCHVMSDNCAYMQVIASKDLPAKWSAAISHLMRQLRRRGGGGIFCSHITN